LKMDQALRKIELVEQLLRKSVTGKPVQIPFEQDLMLARMHVAGTYYYEAEKAVGKISPGQRLALRREPGNVHDELAIEVLVPNGPKLGYIPRRINEIPARLMDAGKRLFVRMESLAKRGTWVDIEISLYMEDY